MGKTSLGRGIASTSLCLLVACGSTDKVGGGAGGSITGGSTGSGGVGGLTITGVELGGSGGRGGSGGAPSSIDAGPGIDGGPPARICGSTAIPPQRERVDILVVLDRSASMYYSIAEDCYCVASIGGGTTSPLCATSVGCTNRWDAVSAAVKQTMATMTNINWGLEMFPSPGPEACAAPAAPQVPIAADNGAALQSAIAHGAPTGNTPTATAIATAAAYLPTVADGLKRAILLATDGAPNCAGGNFNNFDDLPATLTAIAGAFAAGLPVYVVGIGPTVGNLNQMAQAGGTGAYFPATSPKQLADALLAISRLVATTCVFQTPTDPPDDSKVWVYVDKHLVAEDPANGWTFGASSSTVVLTGATCDNYLAGVTTTVEIVFGCKDEPPPPIIP